MSVNIWKGDAQAVAQVSTVQVTAYDATTTYTATIGNKTVSVLGVTDAAGTAAALQAAIAACGIAEFAEATWTVSTDTITATAATPGVPFTVTSGVSGGSGTIGAVATPTASRGPNHWDTAANWTLGTVPVDTDDVVVAGGAGILYGLSQSGVTLGSMVVRSTFTGGGGLPEYNASGYREYRPTYLAIGVAHAGGVTVGGDGQGAGSGRFKHDAGSVQCSWRVLSAGNGTEQGVPAVLVKGSHASNTLSGQMGTMGVAFLPGETATVATVTVGWVQSRRTDAAVSLGGGCTLATIIQSGGTLAFSSDVTTLTQRGGTAAASGACSVATLDSQGGTLAFQSSGTVGGTALTLGAGAVLDLSGDPRTKTVSNLVMHAGSSFLDPAKTAASTLGLTLSECGLADVKLDLGSGIVLSRA